MNPKFHHTESNSLIPLTGVNQPGSVKLENGTMIVPLNPCGIVLAEPTNGSPLSG